MRDQVRRSTCTTSGIAMGVPALQLRALEKLRWAHGMRVWESASLQERVANALHVGMDDLERELSMHGVTLHLPPAIDGLAAWHVDRVVATQVPRWRRPLRTPRQRTSGILLPPSEQRRVSAIVRTFRRLSKARPLDRDTVLQEALERGVAALAALDVPPRVPSPFAPLAMSIDLPGLWTRRLFGWIRDASQRPRRHTRPARRRAMRRGRRARRSRAPPIHGGASDDEPPRETPRSLPCDRGRS